MDRSAEELRISTTRYGSSSSDTSTRLITTLVVKELTWEYSGSLRAETIKACARAAIRDLRGSISPEALPEMAVRLAKVRLAETAADVNTPSPAKTAWESTPLAPSGPGIGTSTTGCSANSSHSQIDCEAGKPLMSRLSPRPH